MKLNIKMEGLFEKPEYDDGGHELGSQELVYPYHQTASILVMRMN